MGCEPVEARMRSVQIVVDPPVFNNVPGMTIAAEQVLVETFVSRSRPLKLSTKPFCMGLPGAM